VCSTKKRRLHLLCSRQALDYDDDVNKHSHQTPDDKDASTGAYGFRMDNIRTGAHASHQSPEQNTQTVAQAPRQAKEENISRNHDMQTKARDSRKKETPNIQKATHGFRADET